MSNDWRQGYSEYDDGVRRAARYTDAPGHRETSDTSYETSYSRYNSAQRETYTPPTYRSSYAAQDTSRSYYGVRRGYGGAGAYREDNNDDELSRPSYRGGYGYAAQGEQRTNRASGMPRRLDAETAYAPPRSYDTKHDGAYTSPQTRNATRQSYASPRTMQEREVSYYAPPRQQRTRQEDAYAQVRGSSADMDAYSATWKRQNVQPDKEYASRAGWEASPRQMYAPPRYTDTRGGDAPRANSAPPSQNARSRMHAAPERGQGQYGRDAYTEDAAFDPAYAQPSFFGTPQNNVSPRQQQYASRDVQAARQTHVAEQRQDSSENRQARPVSQNSGSLRRSSAPRPAEHLSAESASSPQRRRMPVNAARQPGQDAVQTQEKREDVQERLTRMRMAGEAALRAQGYEEEDAKAFMDTGMINLDAALGNLNEEGVDPVLSAQQTARMAVIRQAQMDAPLQQPARVKGTHSRPGYEAQVDGEGKKGGKRRMRGVMEWVITLTVAVVVALLLRTFVISFYRVQGPSMQPTLYTDERLLVDKISYRFGEIHRFDIVVCHYPGSDAYYVKRVIALPGDTVSIDEGVVYVNGEALEEPYVVNEDQTSMPETVVPADSYMVFGDNRADSMDSRSIGAISRDAIVGRAVAVTWPVSRIQAIARMEDTAPAAGSMQEEDTLQEEDETLFEMEEELVTDDADTSTQDNESQDDSQTTPADAAPDA